MPQRSGGSRPTFGNAHQSGGWAWSPEQKRQYANDLSYDNHLIAVQAAANRAKGSRSPADWKPPVRGYWCQYATDWIAIKNTWELTATEPDDWRQLLLPVGDDYFCRFSSSC